MSDESIQALARATKEGDREAHKRLVDELVARRTGFLVVWRWKNAYARPHPNAVPLRVDTTNSESWGPDLRPAWVNAVATVEELWEILSWDRYAKNLAILVNLETASGIQVGGHWHVTARRYDGPTPTGEIDFANAVEPEPRCRTCGSPSPRNQFVVEDWDGSDWCQDPFHVGKLKSRRK